MTVISLSMSISYLSDDSLALYLKNLDWLKSCNFSLKLTFEAQNLKKIFKSLKLSQKTIFLEIQSQSTLMRSF